MGTFYKVRIIGKDLFYTEPGLTKVVNYFDGEGKRFIDLKLAQDTAKNIAQNGLTKFNVEVVKYIDQTLEIGTVSPDGKLTISQNQSAE